jgi:hypothetical protein
MLSKIPGKSRTKMSGVGGTYFEEKENFGEVNLVGAN